MSRVRCSVLTTVTLSNGYSDCSVLITAGAEASTAFEECMGVLL